MDASAEDEKTLDVAEPPLGLFLRKRLTGRGLLGNGLPRPVGEHRLSGTDVNVCAGMGEVREHGTPGV